MATILSFNLLRNYIKLKGIHVRGSKIKIVADHLGTEEEKGTEGLFYEDRRR